MSGLRGWCPTLYEPLASGDGLLVRIKPPLGQLNQAAASALATAARRWGNGDLELTNRGLLQARGFSEASLPSFREAVLAVGLASLDPRVERRRNVSLSPFASSADAVLAVDLERWITEDDSLAALPPKFGFAIAAPEHDPRPPPGDILIAFDGAGWRITLGAGERVGVTADPLRAVQSITHDFIRAAAGYEDPPRRMADLVALRGHDAFFDSAGISPADPRRGRPDGHTVAGPVGGAVGLGLAFGAFSADDLDRAADLAAQFGDGVLRLSAWRALVLAGVPEATLPALISASRSSGFIVDRSDPRLLVVACVGCPGCTSGQAMTRRDAAKVAERRPEHLVHLSGCPKGCAHPASAPTTLIAGPNGYGLVRNGRASDIPDLQHLTLEAVFDLLAPQPSETP